MTSNRLQLLLNNSGQVTGVYQCVGGTPTGSNLITAPAYFAREIVSGTTVNPTSFSYSSGTGNLTFGFPSSGSLTVNVAQGTSKDYMTFNVTALSSLPDKLNLPNFSTSLTTFSSQLSGMAANSQYAMYLRTLTAAGWGDTSSYQFQVVSDVPTQIVGTTYALGGCDYGANGSGVITDLAGLIADKGLLTSSVGGPSAISRRSINSPICSPMV